MKTFKRISASLLLATGGLCSIPVHAATTTFTVNTLTAGAADSNVGNGICLTVAGECSLRAALEEANAMPASPGDDIRIVFDAALNGDVVHNGGTPRMYDETLGSTVINDYLGFGAYLHVNAQRPVTIDFGNRIGAVQESDHEYAMLYIESDSVVIQNFQNAAKREAVGGGYGNAAGIMGAASSIVIGGSNVTVRNGLSADAGTDAMESCISLIDGASNILIEDYYCRSAALFALYVDERATVSNVALNRFETQDGVRHGDIWVEYGQGGETGVKTVVNGLTITNSEFRSDAINYTIAFRENSVVNGLVVTASRFLGANVPSIYAYAGSGMGAALVQDNTATGTGFFFATDVDIVHTGVLSIRNNILSRNLDNAIFLQSPTSGTVIENNRLFNQRSAGLVAGIRIATGASGTNNVIRDNVFDQAFPPTETSAPVNRFAIWMRAQPQGAGGSGGTGWSVQNNVVRNIFGDNYGPIFNDGDSNTVFRGNTFGEGTRGAVNGDPAPENDDSFFVVNADRFSNGKIQTWRTNGAVYTGSTVRVAVAPVADADVRAGNTQPTLPVAIDVYHTATDKAETYLGRIPGTHSSETVFEFSSTAIGGSVRAQITDALGRSSQYSAAQAVVQGVDRGADGDGDGLPNGAECVINLLGIPLICRDSDGDGTPDYLDTDDDNDGIPTRVECPTGSPCVDTDGDGTSNHLDLDSDGDGILDEHECPAQACRDTDGDGMPNYIDTDSDGDGLEDAVECPDGAPCLDVDANGVEDYLELPGTLEVRGTGGGALGAWLLLPLGALALMRRRAAIAAALGLSAAVGNAQAADDEGWTSRFYGGASAGALFTNFDEGGLTSALQARYSGVERIESDGDGLGYGLWLGYALNSYLGLELSYTTGADERVSFSGAVGDDLQGALDVASPYLTGYGDTYLLRLRYHHALNDRWFLSPHVGVGLTQTRQTFTSRDRVAKLEEDTFTWAVGGGVHYALTRDWSIGVGADYYQSDSENAYGLVSGIVEWRFPRALPLKTHSVKPVAPKPVRVVPLGADSDTIELHGVVFESGSDRLTESSREILNGVVSTLKGRLQKASRLQIEVAGHTDSSGNETRNVELSQARAQAVLNYLVGRGVERERLSAVGYGASQPVASNDTAEGRAQNRRVELKSGNR